jgi:hypothetical protein
LVPVSEVCPLQAHDHRLGSTTELADGAGQTGTSYVLVYAEGQTSQWDALWPLFRAMIESISAG